MRKSTPGFEHIRRLLLPEDSLKSGAHSQILSILSGGERTRLKKYFDVVLDKTDAPPEPSDLQIKFQALNALFVLIKNNRGVEEEFNKERPQFSEDMALSIYEISRLVYENSRSWLNYLYMASYATLADKLTLLDFVAERRFLHKPQKFSEQILELIVGLISPIRSREDLERQKQCFRDVRDEFSRAQESNQPREQKELLSTIAYSNIIDLAEKLHPYLETGEGKNITTLINNATANAVQVFALQHDREWEIVSGLLRFVFHKICAHSVWTYANTAPFFKDLIEKQIERGHLVLSLFPSQKQAIRDILATRKSTVLSMPTSSGKTLLAELKIAYTRSLYPEACTVAYVVPTNALVNQTLRQLRQSFPDLCVEKLLPYNHLDFVERNIFQKRKPDVLVSTPEKLNFLTKNDEDGLLKNLRLLIIDEAHNIGDENRGSVIEFLIANFKQEDAQLSYLLLTPFIPNNEEIAQWLDENNFVAPSVEWSPTKQYIGCHCLRKNKTASGIHYLPSHRNVFIKEETLVDLGRSPTELQKTIGEERLNEVVRNVLLTEKFIKFGGTILILEEGAPTSEKLAKKLYRHFGNLNSEISESDKKKISYAQELVKRELGEKYPLTELLGKGFAWHHANMPPSVKEAVEDLINEDLIQIVVATTTLAQGVNFPIKTLIFETLYLGRKRELTSNEFWNIAGRAGRAHKSTEGHIIIGWQGDIGKTKKKTENFIKRDTEDAISSLKDFFDNIEENTDIDYKFVQQGSVAQNFLHYLNHIMNIAHNYKLNQVSQQDIRNLLTNSLFFKQSEFRDGFLESQGKVIRFGQKYVERLKKEGKSPQLKLADTLGITDISLGVAWSRYRNNKGLTLSKCIESGNKEDLGKIMEVIHKIPEIKINFSDRGWFDGGFIAGVLMDWINGKSIAQISASSGKTIDECSHYIFSRLRNYIPWGMAIYQKISEDENKLLPSYAFYGVKDPDLVKLSYIGVPRFALKDMKKHIPDRALFDDIGRLRDFVRTENFALEENRAKNEIVNKIIKNSII